MTPHPLIELRSDNAAGTAPEIMRALADANTGSALAYGADAWTERLTQTAREAFDHPSLEIFPVITGTAANALGLSALCPPWGAVLCHETAHILRSECGATSLFAAGAVMRGVPGDNFWVDPAQLQQAFADTRWGDPHHSQPAVLSLTHPTDRGTVYPKAQLTALTQLARERGLRVHMDGARLANALAASGDPPAELTWKAGVEMLSLGATKNGALSADAVLCFDPALADALRFRLKRAGHVASKMRFQSVQLQTYLSDKLWLRLASQANATMRRLHGGLVALGFDFVVTPQVNMAFVRAFAPMAQAMRDAGLLFYPIGGDVIRFVTSFQTTDAEIDEVLERVAQVVAS